MKLFISLIASFFLIVGCGGNEEETGAGDEKVVGDGENPEANDSGSNSALATCVPHEEIGSGSDTVPVPISGESNLELTQLGVFNCPQVALSNCTSCELLMHPYLGLTISLECTSSGDSGYFPVENGTFIAQIGMSCTKNEVEEEETVEAEQEGTVEEEAEETVEAEGTEAEQTTDQ